MIVPKMTLPEIKQSLMRDYDKELRMKINSIHILWQRKWLQTHKDTAIETIHHTSQNKNQWHIVIYSQKNMSYTIPYHTYVHTTTMELRHRISLPS
jgi:hypothetical protein